MSKDIHTTLASLVEQMRDIANNEHGYNSGAEYCDDILKWADELAALLRESLSAEPQYKMPNPRQPLV